MQRDLAQLASSAAISFDNAFLGRMHDVSAVDCVARTLETYGRSASADFRLGSVIERAIRARYPEIKLRTVSDLSAEAQRQATLMRSALASGDRLLLADRRAFLVEVSRQALVWQIVCDHHIPREHVT